MRTDPVPQVLPRRGFRESVTAGAQYGHKHSGWLDLTGLWIVNRYRGSCVIDKKLLASAVILPQHQVEFLQPAPV